MAACLTLTRSTSTPKSGPASNDGIKFTNATMPTKDADAVKSHAIQPIVTLCIQTALDAKILPQIYIRKSLKVKADRFMLES